ncbi:MAG TPA: hypothetical protein VMU79_11870 [Casimicrobiaceae bacterium]|jgi:hypothetical protein|nr:hypothetical protein [Casimicrobiaceae bacterium]
MTAWAATAVSSARAPVAVGSSATRWLRPDLITLPIAVRRCIVRNALNGAALELSAGEHALLTACEGWRTIAEHEAHASAQLAVLHEHRPAVRELLDRCAQRGLLVSVPELVSRFGAPSNGRAAPFGGVVIRTADRPRLLARLLASAVALEARAGEKKRWIVIDDSHDPANEQANRTVIADASSLEVEHYDRAAEDAFQDALVREFPREAREIAWLLAPAAPGEATYGRALNHALLRLAGRAFVSIDDDVQLEPRRPPLSDPGFAVSDRVDELTWYENEESLLRHCPPANLDPIAQHARWLGLPMADAWLLAEQQSGPLTAMQIAAPGAGEFAPDARITLTRSHSCGDPGSAVAPLHLFALPERSRQWLESNPSAVAYALDQRINWRGHTRLRLLPGLSLTLTTIAGIDNSRLLPPTVRSERSEDVLLGDLAHWVHRGAWQVDLPFGVLHLREPAKRWLGAKDPIAPKAKLLVPLILAHVVRNKSAVAALRPEQRLAAAAASLADLAAASDAQLQKLLLEYAAEEKSRVLFSIRTQLEDETLPAAWRELLQPWLASPMFSVDEATLRARTPPLAAVRALIDAYSRALRVWPQLWEFCRERNR